MKEYLVRIEKRVSLAIFDEPVIKENLEELFQKMSKQILERIIWMENLLPKADFMNEDFRKMVCLKFKVGFCKKALNIALGETLAGESEYRLDKNILNYFCENKVEEALFSVQMFNAFIESIRDIPSPTYMDTRLQKELIAIAYQKLI